MNVGRAIIVSVLGLFLVSSVGAANLVVAGERTVLDANFVDRSIAEEDGYATLEDQIVQVVSEEITAAEVVPGEQLPVGLGDVINVTAAVDGVITEQYVRNQSRTNLQNVYGYLHGARSDPGLAVDLSPVKGRLAETIEGQLQQADIPALIAETAPETEAGPFEITGERVEQMTQSEAGYQTVRAEVREGFRALLFERLRENDPGRLLLTVGINPRQYESDAERRQAVDENEAAIREQIRESTENDTGDRIDQAYSQALEDQRERLAQRIRDQTRNETESMPANVTESLIDLQIAVLNGLADEEVEYDAFLQQFESAETRLTAAAASVAAERLDEEVPDTIDLTDDLDDQTRDQLSQTASQVQLVDLLQWILPMVAIVLVGLIYLITRSVQTVAWSIGSALGIVGLSGVLSARVFERVLTQAIESNLSGPDQAELRSIATGVVENVAGTLEGQSLLLLGGGIVGLLVWLTLRYELIDRFQE